MPSATDFFPAYITEFMNFVMMMFPNFGSGSTSRFSAEWRRDILSVPDYFGRFAPYFERRCLRFLTPWVSRTLRRLLQRRHLLARLLYDARTCDQLVDRRHVSLHLLFVRNREAAPQILNRDHLSHPVTPRNSTAQSEIA